LGAPVEKILILGGTKEAVALAAALVAAGHDVTTSLAGRTKEPVPLAGKLRIGGFGGAAGLATWLSENDITRLIDATHPFAKTISANAVLAADLAGVKLEIRTRKPWQQMPGDRWTMVSTLEQAAAILPPNATVLLALGKQYLSAFETRPDCHFIIRMVDPPEFPLPFARHQLLIGKPSSDWKEEAALLASHKVETIVCRNSGGDGAYAKIVAAREMGLPVVMIERG
jgi:precorrin-6A/cobalt-precorrin-6A reductase